MKFAKTFCKPGSYVEVAPIGLQARLQYNKNGLLQKVEFAEPDSEGRVDFTQEAESHLLKLIYRIVPTNISLKDGTTWIEGVFFTKTLPKGCNGNIAYAATGEYIAKMIDGEEFDFYAGNVRSLAASFKGALTVRNWLMSNGFKVLPGIVVPVEMKQETLDMLFSAFTAPFNPKFIAAFYIFEGINEARFVPSGLYYGDVTKCEMTLDADGYVKGALVIGNNEVDSINFSDAVKFRCNEAPNTKILYTRSENGVLDIVASTTNSSKPAKIVTSYKCPICNKQVVLPKSGPVQCDDPNCLSVLYPDACKMLNKLMLPELSYAQYREYIEDKKILCLTDILQLDNYKDIKVEVTPAEALSAIVPIHVVSDESLFDKLTNSCSQSIDSLMYYLKNPNRIITELSIPNPMIKKFISWISDPYNLTSVETLFSLVELKARKKKFDGAPIFRNNYFMLTGKFKRGNYQEIASILESYSAIVLTDFESKLPDAVITGGTNEDISGAVIKKARLHNITTIDEDSFFSRYGIDDDLAANLL